ncbi:MAG: LacI family DNA-binding transcriptional regulator [Anaerolineae bacterium]|nr:LacI family DNA-binding transcriptional regulator [Anaerolineae bacterium]
MVSVTIKQIAEELGVNPSTVSRALAGSPRVSEDTRKRVLQLARQLNYTPNLWAQNLVSTSSHLIGCLVLELSNPFYVPVVRAIESIAHQNNFMVFLGESQRQLEMEKAVIDRFRRIRTAGVIATPLLAELEHLVALETDGVPVVLVGRSAPGFFSVNVDNQKSGNMVGKHLLRNGHRNIGYVSSSDPLNIPEQERLKGLKSALQDAGILLNRHYQVDKNNLEGGQCAGQLWLSTSNRPTAIFCSNDMLAMGFISTVLKNGLSVPGDVAVVGHDDVPFADLFKVSLTTVAYPKDEVGVKAMDILLQRINNSSSHLHPINIILDTELVVRDSCGATG